MGIEPRDARPGGRPDPPYSWPFRFHVLLYHAAARSNCWQIVREATSALKPPEDVIWTVDVDPVDML